MSPIEVFKRFAEHLDIFHTQIKYRNPNRWPYSRFARSDIALELYTLPGIAVINDWRHYRIYNAEFDLTKPLDWYFSEKNATRWPACHYARLNYRPGNPTGDVRINWELNRLQFLPAMAISNEDLARNIIIDWIVNNPYLHAPSYLSSMEVALRWISISWAVSLFKQPLEISLLRDLTGLAVASGKFIESRLSTHSSAGNHLIVEAVGLFWLGKALKNNQLGVRWITKARKILWEQIDRQINPDGSNKEQSFWYLGFVLDAVFHYILLERRSKIPAKVWGRVEKMIEFINDLTLPDGSFPDYGDRDDGFVFRLHGTYDESPFNSLLSIGSFFFNRSELHRDSQQARETLAFWTGAYIQDAKAEDNAGSQKLFSDQPRLKTYNDGGMTLLQWGKGSLLFKHACLGLANTYAHGHADALSVLFYWGNVPVLIDLGSGQYNGDQAIRNFFRSTIAHNTIEIGGRNQARILGPFMWEKSYETKMVKATEMPVLSVEASHNGYRDDFSISHIRKVVWLKQFQIEILDSFSGPRGVPMRGAFHIGTSQALVKQENMIKADFGNFVLSLTLPSKVSVAVYYGSKHPFMGWRSTVYGKWEPTHSIVYSGKLQSNNQFKVSLTIAEN